MDANVMEQRLKQWIPVFEEQAQSGLNKQDWCRQNGVKRSAFFKWQRECRAYLLLKKGTCVTASSPAFVELSCGRQKSEVVDAACDTGDVSSNSPSIAISHNGFSISLQGLVDEENLTRVLRAVSHVN